MDLKEERDKIRNELIQKGYANKKISYEEFLKLYSPYKLEMSEEEFAGILEISYSIFYKFKKRNGRTIALSSMNTLTEKRKKEIKEKFINENYIGKSISYEEFLELYSPYRKEMTERQFGDILEISYASLRTIKSSKTHEKALILKSSRKAITQERKEEIRTFFINRSYMNVSMDYNEFLHIYSLYRKEMTEQEFAAVLNISYASFCGLKNGKNAVALNPAKDSKLNDKKVKEIQDKLYSMGYAKQKISYEDFLELYSPYRKEIPIQEFATTVLEIQPSAFKALKNGQRKAVILKSKKQEETTERKQEITPERKREIQEELKEHRKQHINYEEFLELYVPYKQELNEEKFANILGITYPMLNAIKQKRCRAKIKFNEVDIEKRIRYLFSGNKYYDIKYFESVSQKYNCTIEEIFRNIYPASIIYARLIKKALYEKGQIFIGNKKINDDFLKKHDDELSRLAHKYSKKLGQLFYTSEYAEDIAQDTLIEVIQNKGDVVENLSEDDAINMLKKYIIKIIKVSHSNRIKEQKDLSLDQSRNTDETRILHEKLAAKENVHDEVAKTETFEQTDIYMAEIKKCILDGMSKQETITFIMEKYGLSAEELIEAFSDKIENKKAKKLKESNMQKEKSENREEI